jgi:hypothetical protein
MFSASKSASVSGAYTLSKSLRIRSSANAYLNRTFGAGNQQKWTFSTWFKIGIIGNNKIFLSCVTAGNEFYINSNDQLVFNLDNVTVRQTTMIFRDTSAWYHLVIALDTTNATTQNRVRIYINGIEITSWFYNNAITQNSTPGYNSAVVNNIGRLASGGLNFDGYMTDVYWVDGQQLTPSSFGATDATTGQWVPAKYTGTYGTNGFHLTFSDATSTTTLGYDTSGNSNNWTPNNISLTAGSTYDSMNDVPTLTSATVANYCVLNPLATGSGKVLVNGNLEFTSNTTGWYFTSGTIGFSSGKYYWEVNIGSSAGSDIFAGIMGSGMPTGSVAQGLQDNVSLLNTYGSLLFCDDGKYQLDGNTSRVAYSTYLTANQTLGIAVDMGAKSLTFYKDGVSQGAISFSSSPMANSNVCPVFSSYYSTDSNRVFNFGQRAFAYTPPSGYLALNTYNLPTSTVPKGSSYMNAVLQLGSAINTGANLFAQSTYTYGLAWSADRSGTGNHVLVDTLRGTSNALVGNSTSAQSSYGAPTSTDNFVAWVWNSSTTGVSNTDGSLTSTVSASTPSGFSIVTYTGNPASAQTVGHGLGVSPSMIITRQTAGGNWNIYHKSLGIDQYIYFSTAAANTVTGYWGSTAPSSTTFGVIGGGYGNNSGATVAYCFAPIAGFSAFGSYVGNGSASGPFVYLGFRPKFLIIRYTGVESWFVFDTSRGTYNLSNPFIQINQYTETEYAFDSPAMLSNGFALTTINSSINGSGNTMIYMAFAENPFKYANAR